MNREERKDTPILPASLLLRTPGALRYFRTSNPTVDGAELHIKKQVEIIFLEKKYIFQ
jgi:hypothetical protein